MSSRTIFAITFGSGSRWFESSCARLRPRPAGRSRFRRGGAQRVPEAPGGQGRQEVVDGGEEDGDLVPAPGRDRWRVRRRDVVHACSMVGASRSPAGRRGLGLAAAGVGNGGGGLRPMAACGVSPARMPTGARRSAAASPRRHDGPGWPGSPRQDHDVWEADILVDRVPSVHVHRGPAAVESGDGAGGRGRRPEGGRSGLDMPVRDLGLGLRGAGRHPRKGCSPEPRSRFILGRRPRSLPVGLRWPHRAGEGQDMPGARRTMAGIGSLTGCRRATMRIDGAGTWLMAMPVWVADIRVSNTRYHRASAYRRLFGGG